MRLVDEAYNSLTFEARYYDWPAKLLFVTSLGVGLLFKDMMGSIWRLTVRFDPDPSGSSRVTVVGKAPARARAALGTLAAEHGGAVGLRVGV